MTNKFSVSARRLSKTIGCAIGMLVMTACNHREKEEEKNLTLPVLEVRNEAVEIFRQYPVTLAGEADVEVRAMVSGYLTEICVDEGDYVEKGTVLFRIEPDLYREQKAQAEAGVSAAGARLEKAAIELKNTEELFAEQLTTETGLRLARADHQTAEAALQEAKAHLGRAEKELEYTVIRATSEGFVGRIPYRIGTRVTPDLAQPLTVLSAIRQMRAYFSLGEVDFLNLSEQGLLKVDTTEVMLTLANGSGYPQKGRIDAIDGLMQQGSMTVRATFDNEKRMLRSGSTGSVGIPYLKGNYPLIPKQATFKIQDRSFVYRVDREGVLHAQAVSVADYDAKRYAVLGGLEEGVQILRSGLSKVQEGMRIAVNKEEENKQINE